MWSPSVMFTVQITDIQSGNKRNFQRVKRNDREGMSTFESNPNLSPIIILEIHPEKKRQNNEAARFISTFCRSSINLSYISRRRGTIWKADWIKRTMTERKINESLFIHFIVYLFSICDPSAEVHLDRRDYFSPRLFRLREMIIHIKVLAVRPTWHQPEAQNRVFMAQMLSFLYGDTKDGEVDLWFCSLFFFFLCLFVSFFFPLKI